MTRIGSKGLVLVLLLFALVELQDVAAKISEVDFYRDGELRMSPELRLKRLLRFLEVAAAHSSGSQQHKQRLLELARQKLRGLLRNDMPEEPGIIETLQRDTVDPVVYLHGIERQRLLPYLEYDSKPKIKPFSTEDESRTRLVLTQLNKDPLLDYPETHYADLDRTRQQENARRIEEAYRQKPKFTYFPNKLKIDDDSETPAPFAVAPNDPRYFENDVDKEARGHKHLEGARVVGLPEMREIGSADPQPQSQLEPQPQAQLELKSELKPQTHTKSKLTLPRTRVPTDETVFMNGFLKMNVLPEPQRRAEQDPLVVSLGNRLNDDIYFIAIVAGCSAAVMFALVLISLTWCRFQRMSKAAVDVDYPAYGITGPNKDISPSGDQRLAQSAQMYHFQHHKQQIIAMEKATRDPGSVSEAESDEENEEGDYTVYECPGLAPTGEMEVKNPLFLDDLTPGTPSKSKKDGEESDDNNI